MSLLLTNKRRKKIATSSDNVVLYLKGDVNPIVDSSISPKTITLNGNTTSSSVQSKYGGSSILLDGTGDYLSADASSDSFNIRTDSYTIETWFYSTESRSQFFFGDTGGNVYLQHFNLIIYWGDGVINTISSATTIALNTWKHYALSFDGTTTRLFVDGVLRASTTSLLKSYTWSTFVIGARLNGSPTGQSKGYFDSVRITKGVARYTSNFNPETDTYLNV
jgi:hypothetical protein